MNNNSMGDLQHQEGILRKRRGWTYNKRRDRGTRTTKGGNDLQQEGGRTSAAVNDLQQYGEVICNSWVGLRLSLIHI